MHRSSLISRHQKNSTLVDILNSNMKQIRKISTNVKTRNEIKAEDTESVFHPDSLERVCVGDALLVLANVRLVIHPHEVVWLR